jgi:4-hydroxy-tetrahydrodipicolinate reductase
MGNRVLAVARGTGHIDICGFLDPRRTAKEVLAAVPVFNDIPREGPKIDVVIDFSTREAIGSLVEALRGSGVRLVCGTTGLDDHAYGLLKAYSDECAVFYDSNMSYGITVTKRLLETAGKLLRDTADVEIVELHHRGKTDFPSGTAFGLARAIGPDDRLVAGRMDAGDEVGGDGTRTIHTHSLRIGGIPGEHQVWFGTDDEVVTISHRALSRDVFARGAVRAARFIAGKNTGIFSMDDLTGV